jgi:hypothetical protein
MRKITPAMKSRILIKIGGRAFEGKKGFTDLAAAIRRGIEDFFARKKP